MQFYLFLTGPKVAQLTPPSNYASTGIGNKVLHRSRCCNECFLPTPLQAACLCILPLTPICCCYCCHCLCLCFSAAAVAIISCI